VYVAGINGNNRATLWTNGTPQELDTVVSVATVVYVHGKDVYVAGTRGAGEALRPVLWKNGSNMQSLSESRGDKSWTPTHISVYNNDVCVAGFSNGNGRMRPPVLWKNGKDAHATATIPLGEVSSVLNVVTLSDNDVYIVVDHSSNHGRTREIPKTGLYLVKNGQAQHIADESGGLESIHVSNKNAYIIKNDRLRAFKKVRLWKNNVEQKLEGFEDPETLQEMSTEANHVFASGDNVYVFGRRSKADTFRWDLVIWKNGVAEIFAGGDERLNTIASVFVVE